MADNQNASVEYIVLTVEQAAKRLNIGRTLMYALVSNGEVESVLIGRLRRIPLDALTRYIARLSDNGTSHPEVA
ncbi:excisionase family DNA-binding protein [Saccharothrix saharensis]|uniref:excisionase family DNA-binding protein n=1 Tax=Saccharothrix saharensis TaxID=571190 RepID=UPI00368A7998